MLDVDGDDAAPTPSCCRRALLQGVAGLSLAATAGSAWGQGAEAPAGETPADMRPQPGDLLVRAAIGAEPTPLTIDDLQYAPAPPVEAWPMEPATSTVRSGSLFNRVLLLRFDPAHLTEAAREKFPDGVVAHTIICTHAACEVTTWLAAEWVLECPCHFSRYDPRNLAAVVQGPAMRRLPALGLKVENGRLAVAAPFDSRVGGDADE